MAKLIGFVLGLFAASTLVFALQESKTPTLTETQKLQFRNLSQQIEIAQLRAQLAQRDFEMARRDMAQLAASLAVKGFTLDVASLTYRADPPSDDSQKTAP